MEIPTCPSSPSVYIMTSSTPVCRSFPSVDCSILSVSLNSILRLYCIRITQHTAVVGTNFFTLVLNGIYDRTLETVDRNSQSTSQ